MFNIDNGEMSGVEVELMATPVTGLLLQASYAYLDSKLDDVDNPFYNPEDPLSSETVEGSFGNAPEHTYSFVAGYTFPATTVGVVNANASYNYVGERDPDSETTYRDAYDLINARVALSEIDRVRADSGKWLYGARTWRTTITRLSPWIICRRPVARSSGATGAATGSMSRIATFK